MKLPKFLRRTAHRITPPIFRHEFYPICLTCFSVMTDATNIPSTNYIPPNTYYCYICGEFRAPAKIRGCGFRARLVRAIAASWNIKPLEVKRHARDDSRARL